MNRIVYSLISGRNQQTLGWKRRLLLLLLLSTESIRAGGGGRFFFESNFVLIDI